MRKLKTCAVVALVSFALASRSWAAVTTIGVPNVVISSGAATAAVSNGSLSVNVATGSVSAFQAGSWNVGQVGSYTVTPGTGTWNTSGSSVTAFQGGSPWSISGSTITAYVANSQSVTGSTVVVIGPNGGPVLTSLQGSVTVTPGTGTWSTSGSTNTVYQGGSPWSVTGSSITSFQSSSSALNATVYQGGSPWFVTPTVSSVAVYDVAGTSLNVNASQVGNWNVGINTGTNQIGLVSGSSVTAFQGDGLWRVAFASGSISNPFYTISTNTSGQFSNPEYVISTNTVISTGSITAFQGGNWSLNATVVSSTNTQNVNIISTFSAANPGYVNAAQNGAYTVTPGTGIWSTSGSTNTVYQGGAPWTVTISSSANTAGITNGRLNVDTSLGDIPTFAGNTEAVSAATSGSDNPILLIVNPSTSTLKLKLLNRVYSIATTNRAASFELSLDPVVTSSGSAQPITAIGTSTSSVAQFYTLPTVSSNGNLVDDFTEGQNTQAQFIPDNKDITIKAGHTALVAVDPSANSTLVTISFKWTEE